MSDFAEPALLAVFAIILALPAMVWIAARWRWRSLPQIPSVSAAEPDCMVVIPARNEQAIIARAIASFPPDTVIVVDDESSDGTANAAQQGGAGVLRVTKPQGAIGKLYACQQGAALLRSRWVLFASADTWYDKRFLASVTAFAESQGIDFLSIRLTPSPATWLRHLLTPCTSALFFCTVRPKANPAAAFAGQCVLARRSAYEFLGGHGALRHTLNDGLRLAQLAERHRLRIGIARSGALGHAGRPSGSFYQELHRSAYRALEASSSGFLFAFAMSLLAAGWLPIAALLLWWHLPWAAAAAGVAPVLGLVGWYRNWRAILAPVAVWILLLFLIPAVLTAAAGRNITWKDRTI